jgi:exopolyphosphatase/guanosine-5'-triphosphate,3'-diphosphate pyrophosphatase
VAFVSTLKAELLETQVITMSEKYHYEKEHCHRVAEHAQQLFELFEPLHGLGESEALLLRHATLLHEVGHSISYRGHHRHGAYLILSDMALSSYPEESRQVVAMVIRNHRKKAAAPPRKFSKARALVAMQLSAILRLADGLDHDRAGTAAIVSAKLTRDQIQLEVSGLALDSQKEILKDKAALIKPVFNRKLVWVTSEPSGREPSEDLVVVTGLAKESA